MHKSFITYGTRLLFFMLSLLSLPQTATAQKSLSEIYTKESPLTIVIDWDFPPYEYNDTYGEITGFDVDILEAVLKRMSVEYTIETCDWTKAKEMFRKGEADMVIDPYNTFNESIFHYSSIVLTDYNLRIAQHKDSPTITDISQLKSADGIQVRFNDSITVKILKELLPETQIRYSSVKYALSRIANGQEKYMLWGGQPLIWKIKELGMEEVLKVSELVIPVGEFRVVSTNKTLVDQFDDTFARMEQAGELQQIRDKWFNPERLNRNTPTIVITYIAIALVIVVIIMIAIKRIHVNERKLNNRAEDIEHMMRTALDMNEYTIIEHDLNTGITIDKYGTMLPKKGVGLDELFSHFHPDDRNRLMSQFTAIKSGDTDKWDINAQWKSYVSNQYVSIQGNAVSEKGEDGKIRYIVGAVKNITNEVEQERRDNELANRFVKMFDSTLVAMSLYDKDGHLIDFNTNMRKLCNINDVVEEAFRSTLLKDMPLIKGDFDPDSHERFFICQHLVLEPGGVDKYIEFSITPAYEKGELIHYLITARDVTYARELYFKLKQQKAELHNTNEQIKLYESELNYLLENSQMWVWSSDVASQTISFSRSLQKKEFTLSFSEYVSNLYEDQKETAMKALGGLAGEDINFNVSLHFRKSPVSAEPQWVAISGIPMHDGQGKVTGHFGIVRDITKLMETQDRLKYESMRSEDSGKLKSIFLANMTHEIRTPLNAIVGFSDLLQVIDDPNERKEFIRIIRNNCDMLMRLINDIIEASNMNQGSLAIETEEVDFAIVFNDICQILAQRIEEPGVEFIIDNPYASFVTRIDKGRLQQVITNFTTNAVKYTHQGHIKVGYRKEENVRTDNGEKSSGIYMYCEDTGSGIPIDKQSTVFDRFVKLNDFVQGTGLGLSICKSIAERCGGKVGVDSEGEGKGSTFWIWIPCDIDLIA